MVKCARTLIFLLLTDRMRAKFMELAIACDQKLSLTDGGQDVCWAGADTRVLTGRCRNAGYVTGRPTPIACEAEFVEFAIACDQDLPSKDGGFDSFWVVTEEEEEEEETLFDPKSTNVQITIPHISDIQFKQLCTHIYRHYVHKHSS